MPFHFIDFVLFEELPKSVMLDRERLLANLINELQDVAHGYFVLRSVF